MWQISHKVIRYKLNGMHSIPGRSPNRLCLHYVQNSWVPDSYPRHMSKSYVVPRFRIPIIIQLFSSWLEKVVCGVVLSLCTLIKCWTEITVCVNETEQVLMLRDGPWNIHERHRYNRSCYFLHKHSVITHVCCCRNIL